MSYALDLTKRHFCYHRGEILAIGTWALTNGQQRPALVLIRAGDEFSERLVPCIIPLDMAWMWSEEVGDPAACAWACFDFAAALRLEPVPKTIFRIAAIVADLLGDLLSIPPYHPDGDVVADLILKETVSGRTVEVEVR